MDIRIESEQEEDGRWLAEVIGLPGVMAYGTSRLNRPGFCGGSNS
jgi:predicted RNase H-like HicB family nuclease